MKKIRVGINGFGRIGRLVARIMFERGNFEIAAVNDQIDQKNPAKSVKFFAKLFEWDSVHGRFKGTVSSSETRMTINGQDVDMLSCKAPEEIPWERYDIDFVVEATGVFRKREQIEGHLKRGAKKVLLTVPSKDEIDATIVKGVNCDKLKKEHKLISNASCTTNCLASVAHVLHRNFGIKYGFMNTIHAYTNDQRILDLYHKEDLRRARSAAANIIPTSTGAAKTIGKIIPELEGRLDGMAVRVPVQDGSLVDLTIDLERLSASDPKSAVAAINGAMKEASEGYLKGILEYSDDELVSSDIVGNPHSAVFDSKSTMAIKGSSLFKVLAWYDNEWGYSQRCVDIIELACSL